MKWKRSICLVIVPFALVCAADKKAGTKPDPKAAKTEVKSAPDDKLKPGYVRTPFAIVKLGEPAAPGDKVEAPADMKVAEDGDSLRFERLGPLGPMKWVRKKTELTEMEKAAWEREQARKAPPEKNKE
jgi:hypothetical protein